MQLEQIGSCLLDVLHRIYVLVVLLNLLYTNWVWKQSNWRGFSVEIVEKYKLGFLVFWDFGRINAESRRLVFVQIKVQLRLHESFAALMLETEEVPLPGLDLAQIDPIGADLRVWVLGTQNSVEYFVVDHVRFKPALVRRIEGEQFWELVLSPELYVLDVYPKHECHAFLELPRQAPVTRVRH